MTSMRRLNRRVQRWHRYALKTAWNPRHTPSVWSERPIAVGQQRAWDRREWERERRVELRARRWWPR